MMGLSIWMADVVLRETTEWQYLLSDTRDMTRKRRNEDLDWYVLKQTAAPIFFVRSTYKHFENKNDITFKFQGSDIILQNISAKTSFTQSSFP